MTSGGPPFDSPCLRPGPYLGEISALSFLSPPSYLSSLPLLLAGTGSDLLVYDLEDGTLLHSFRVFDGVRVHGISLRSSDDPLIAVFGEKKVKLFILRVDAEPLQLEFVRQLPRFEQWVLDAKFLNEDGCLAVGLSDNSVALWDVDRSILAARFICAERCLLYSMRMWGDSVEALRIASGAIYNEVIVWRLSRQDVPASIISLNSNDSTFHHQATQIGYQQFLPTLLSRLVGHEGSIFRISWSFDGSKLMSVSDDRSARIWKFRGNGLNYHGSKKDLCIDASNNLVLFGHNARIWDCHISDSVIITAGEDCTCRVWDVDGDLLLMFKEHVGRGIWRCLYDENLCLLVTAGFDSTIKVHRVCSPSVRKLTEDDRLLNDVKGTTEVFTIAAPQVTIQGLMDSKSEYVRCLCFAHENLLYVATNNGLLYHVELLISGDVRWIQIAQVNKESPIICMDLMSAKSCKPTSYMEHVIAIGDGMGNATIMKLVGGISTPRVELSFTWTAEKERQLLGIYWCKSLGDSHLFTVDPRGVLKLWKVNNALQCNRDDNNVKPKASFIAVFASHFGVRIMCLDALAGEEVLVCGDQRGNLTVYPLTEGLLNAEHVEIVEKVSAVNHFKGAHGISTVTSISTMLDFNQVEICSTGGDGCICYFKYDKSLQVLEFVGLKQVKELSTVQSAYTCSTSDLDSAKCNYAIGFTSEDFIMWNLENETKILKITCGGWRRPYSYHLGAVPEYQYCFAYVKDLNIHIHRLWVMGHESQQYPQNLHLQYHGREIHSLCFISFPLQSNPTKSCHSLIATGCEDGTVRLTRYSSSSLRSWCESKLLGEHIGGSAVRSVCFASKIYLIGATQACSTSDDALDCSQLDPFLLISVGAKEVLTSWIFRYRTSDVTEKHLNERESENVFNSSKSPITFQWLSTHIPPKCAKNQRIVEKSPVTTEPRNAATVSDLKTEAFIAECSEQTSHSASIDTHENDWRYLAVTAFLVKHVDRRFITCFVVVSCSDGTLSLRAFVLPYRLWFDVALLVSQQAPILALQHVGVPLCTLTNGSNSTRVAHIVISGSTDGSISFWDITETVEKFILLVFEYQPQLLIDCQRRPRTGRGSQGGRWWRYLTKQHGEKTMKGSESNNSDFSSSENFASCSSCGQESHPLNDEIHSHNTIDLNSSSPDKHSMASTLARQDVLPSFVLSSVHQSGVNCLHVSEIKDSSNGKPGRVYCIVSGGDDQAVHYLTFILEASMEISDSICSQTTRFAKYMHDVAPCQLSGSSLMKKCSHRSMNNGYHLRILKMQNSNSAHSSSVKGIWTDGIWVFSTGLDQRVRCWQIGRCGKLIERAHLIISVPEPESLDVNIFNRKRYQIAVAGRGIQTIEFIPNDED